MQLNPSPKVRAAIYISIVIGTAILVPLNIAEIVNNVVMSVWTSVSGAAALLARINIDQN